jgi:hypothetical protein
VVKKLKINVKMHSELNVKYVKQYCNTTMITKLTLWKILYLNKLIFCQLVKKYFVFYGTQTLLTL